MLTILAFWYIGLFVLSGFHGVPFWRIVHFMPVSVLVAMIGLCAGFALAIFLGAGNRIFTADDVARGSSMWDARVSMGSMPEVPQPKRGRGAEKILAEQPWWPAVRARRPEYARALRAVVETMLAIPRLPASPYPGGHGGRSLLEHSLAVCAEMLVQAPKWVYEGQRDKRGNIRVPLTNPDEPHRFAVEDGPLLLLAGLAHDIGKMTCYQVLEDGPGAGRLHQVIEIKPTHDMEGARILRRIPEIMALPRADRTALLTAVAYYHHPFGIPNSTWVTDRIRSLTELLAHTDICVGKAEGHVLLDPKEEQDEDITEGGPVAAVTDATLAAQTGLDPTNLSDDEADLEALGQLAGALASSKPAQPPKPTPAPASAPAPQGPAPVAQENLPMELRLFMTAVRKPGAINGRDRSQRIAWKHGENVYVMDKVMRTLIHNQGGVEPVWAATAMAEANGNAAPFTVALAEQLLERGALVNTFEGQEFSPARALFRMKMSSGNTIPVLIVRASSIPGAASLPDARPVEITGPLWGKKSARNKAAPAPVASSATDGPLSKEVDFDDLTGGTAAPTKSDEPAAAATGASNVTNDDLPFDLAPAQPATDEAPGAPEPAPAPAAEPAAAADELDAASILAGLVTSDSFREKYAYEERERDGKRHALIPLDSDGGKAITRTVDQLREHGANVTKIKVARLAETGERAYVFTLSGDGAN